MTGGFSSQRAGNMGILSSYFVHMKKLLNNQQSRHSAHVTPV